MNHTLRIAGALAPLLAFLPAAAAARPAPPTTPMTATDLVTLARLGTVAVAPDGSRVAYAVTTTDPASLKRTSRIRVQPLQPGGAARELAWDGASEPAFAPDGSLYLLSSHAPGVAAADDATAQVWKVPTSGDVAQAVPVTALKAEVAGFKLAPDGKRLLVWGEVPRTCPTFGGCAPAATTGTGRLYKDGAGFVRHWDAWLKPGLRNRIFAFDLGADGKAAGAGVPLDGAAGNGVDGDAPSRPFGDGAELAWTPDGKSVVFTLRQADRNEPLSTNLDLWLSRLDGAPPSNLTAANKGTDTTPTISPDGKWLAYAAMARPGYEADRLVVHLMDLATGTTRALTGGWDRSVASLTWSADGKALFATAEDVLDKPVFRIDVPSGKVTRLALFGKAFANALGPREGHLDRVTPLADGRFIVSRDSIDAPAELYVVRPGAKPLALTDLNGSRLAARAPVITQRFSFKGAGGDMVWGQVTKPAEASGPLPAILYVHGGPQGSFNDAWSFRWNPRVVASHGFAVVSVDFHGSTGYGQAFTDAIREDWGGKPLEDLKLGFAAAAALDRQVDTANACAMGASYGGYMMNWIAGQWPDKFRCLVQHDGVFDARAMAYETEELWFDEWEHGGHPYYEAPEAYEKWNPVNHVAKWRTPMLVITGENDFRIPYTQGLAAFTALQRRGVPSELLVFPDENHWVLKAKNSLQWHETVFAWLDRWLKQPPLTMVR